MNKLTVSDAWETLIQKYDIKEEIRLNGIFNIKASEIKEIKEPRLMAKWDSSDQLPSSLKKNNINILPNSRSSYILGDFLLYQKLPELNEHIKNMPNVILPELESLDVDNISSEANAINVLQISGILEDFLELDPDDKLYATFNGRMSSGIFSFYVDTVRGIPRKIDVNKAQVEIDGGFESDDYLVILEAKNVLHKDFHIRQLYYPYRLWETKVNKPIKLIFSIYTNKIFRLLEFAFTNKDDYSSIELIKSKNYSLEDTTIKMEDLQNVFSSIEQHNILSDNRNEFETPFIQADNFERIISLLENMGESAMTGEEIEELMQFSSRQRDYYYNAGKYLGIFEKYTDDNKRKYKLTKIGDQVLKQSYKERQLLLVKLILSHRIFYTLFSEMLETGEPPTRSRIVELELEYNVCSKSVAKRRASTVLGWFNWIIKLPML
ncbi:type II restriction enzyme [Streptococcus uberis]|uniref:type II restriction enzyme n=1 Tax=Streptococcus uberis TaxID=1349 RepID=UPI0012B5E94B|nr:type II restriction endonuclease [Streptococcus uberis]MTB36810.1 type II restriction endonuclease [Streptococcus uberis]MTB57792.1 type II restriction endonuclease [Streptococcus uberis]